MLTLFVTLVMSYIIGISMDITQDTQMIIFAICVASDLNILSRMIEK